MMACKACDERRKKLALAAKAAAKAVKIIIKRKAKK